MYPMPVAYGVPRGAKCKKENKKENICGRSCASDYLWPSHFTEPHLICFDRRRKVYLWRDRNDAAIWLYCKISSWISFQCLCKWKTCWQNNPISEIQKLKLRFQKFVENLDFKHKIYPIKNPSSTEICSKNVRFIESTKNWNFSAF